MSLRRRLTLLTTAVLLVATAVLGAVAYFAAASIQYEAIDRNLRAASVVERIKGLIDKPRPLPADVYSTVGVILIDASGQVTTLRPAGYGAAPLSFPAFDAATVAAARQGPVTVGSDPAFRVLASSRNGRGDTIIALTPLDAAQDQLQRLRRGIVLAVLGVTAVGAVLSWLLIRRALRPVGDMVEAAREIAAGDVTRRVPAAPSGTEMGDLADALNTMIASLTASLEEVRASEQRLRAFVSDASHELRTPITVIRGYSELLEQRPASRDELEERALTRIGQESQRLDRLLAQLLMLQRAVNPASPESATTDLGEVFASVFEGFADLHPDRVVTIDVEPCEVTGSAEEWTQAAGNIAQNIDRYTPVGSLVDVAIRVRGGAAEVTVDDSGPGIPVDRREEMLERFTRLDDSRGTDTGGTGLGLSILKAVAEARGGRVLLGESPAGGLRVSLVVPLAAGQ